MGTVAPTPEHHNMTTDITQKLHGMSRQMTYPTQIGYARADQQGAMDNVYMGGKETMYGGMNKETAYKADDYYHAYEYMFFDISQKVWHSILISLLFVAFVPGILITADYAAADKIQGVIGGGFADMGYSMSRLLTHAVLFFIALSIGVSFKMVDPTIVWPAVILFALLLPGGVLNVNAFTMNFQTGSLINGYNSAYDYGAVITHGIVFYIALQIYCMIKKKK